MQTSHIKPVHPVSRREFFCSVAAMLGEGQTVTFRAYGDSMWPLIHDGDEVVLVRRGTYAAGDIVLADAHDPYGVVLHRVRWRDGEFLYLQGDANCCQTERCALEDVAGVVVGIRHGRRMTAVGSVSFRLRGRLWLSLGSLRRVPLALRNIWRQSCSRAGCARRNGTSVR